MDWANVLENLADTMYVIILGLVPIAVITTIAIAYFR